MDLLNDFFINHSVVQAIITLSLICSCGLFLGKVKICGISFGVALVFFIGIVMGAIGLSIDPQMLSFVQNFGLVIFIYSLGLQVGPGFFRSFGAKTLKLNIISLCTIIFGIGLAIIFSKITSVSLPNIFGVWCGANTNTPSLGAAQQTLSQMNLPYSSLALGYAVTYPMGVIGVILVIIFIRRFVDEKRLEPQKENLPEKTFIATFIVCNPAIFGKNLKEISHMSHTHFVVSRLWREGKVTIPVSTTVLERNDKILVVTTLKDTQPLMELFGEQETRNWNNENIDWNAIDSQLSSKRILITKPNINGKRLGSLKLRNSYGVNISRVYRSGVPLLATPDLVLQLGDWLVVVGEKKTIKNVEDLFGNAETKLNEPNLAPFFVGILLGVALGSIPIYMPNISTPIKLGLAGGPIIVGMIIGTFGPRIHMLIYTTQSANLMLRSLGLSLFLACLGLAAGKDFLSTVLKPEGALWVGLGFLLTVVPILIAGFVCYYFLKMDFATISGLISGSMCNPMALNYVNDTLPGDDCSIAYASVYPLAMFSRVILIQVILIMLL
ncbi:MAG: putative transporter [Bacteroidales bacterium]|nr:putative transporter [Bacteroidales bacterium]